MPLSTLALTPCPLPCLSLQSHRERVQTYFSYITQYSHPTTEGMALLYDLPKALYETVAGGTTAGWGGR